MRLLILAKEIARSEEAVSIRVVGGYWKITLVASKRLIVLYNRS
jgi:hypothetical protein